MKNRTATSDITISPQCRIASLRRTAIEEGSCRGQALVEFAMVLPLLVMLLLGLFDFGRGIAIYTSLAHSAREGARTGIYTSATDTDIRDTVRSQGVILTGLPDANIMITPPDPRNSGDSLIVSVAYDFEAATPLISSFWGGGPLRITSTATVRVE